MICEPVFEDPESLRSLLQRAEIRMAAGGRVPDLELAMIIDKHRGKRWTVNDSIKVLPVCTENLNSGVVVMESAKDGA